MQLSPARPSSRPLRFRRFLLPAASVILSVFSGRRQWWITIASWTCWQPCLTAVPAGNATRPSPSVRRDEFAAAVNAIRPFSLPAFTIFALKLILIICLLSLLLSSYYFNKNFSFERREMSKLQISYLYIFIYCKKLSFSMIFDLSDEF